MTTITIPALPSETAPIDDASYMVLSQFGASKKMTVAQFLAKISSQNQGFINNFLGSSDEAAARANLAIDRRTTVSDADYTIVNTDKVVSQIGVMSAPRLFSLPAASTFPAGAELIILDESGTVTPANKITVQRDGTDTINGAPSKEIKSDYGVLIIISDGTSGWKVTGIGTPEETDVPIGSITAYVGQVPPTGYLECNGSLLSRTVYANLFAVAGTTFAAGDGSTTFGIPDLRGEFLRGWDNGRGIDSARVFGSAQDHSIQDHTHSSAAAASGNQILAGGVNGAAISGTTTGAMNTGNIATETRPRNIAIMYCIKY